MKPGEADLLIGMPVKRQEKKERYQF